MQHPEAKRDEFLALIRKLEGKPPRVPQVGLVVFIMQFVMMSLLCNRRHFWSERRAETCLGICSVVRLRIIQECGYYCTCHLNMYMATTKRIHFRCLRTHTHTHTNTHTHSHVSTADEQDGVDEGE